VRTELLPQPPVPPLADEMEIEFAERRENCVRITDRVLLPEVVADLVAIREGLLHAAIPHREEPGVAELLHQDGRESARFLGQNPHHDCVGTKCAEHHAVVVEMDPEDLVRIGVFEAE